MSPTCNAKDFFPVRELRNAAPCVQLFVVDLRTVDARREQLDAKQLRRADRFTREESRERFIRRRLAIRAIARGHAQGDVAWRCPTCNGDDHGAPTLDGASISTSSYGDALVVALAPQGWQLGVDVAPRHAPAEMIGVAKHLFTPQEQADSQPMRVWARKEALGKALGVGLSRDDAAAPRGMLDTHATTLQFEDHVVAGFDDLLIAIAFARATPRIDHL